MPSPVDQKILALLKAGPIAAIADVIAAMQGIDGLLPPTDGLKWFNLLYLQVTQRIDTPGSTAGWRNPAWLLHLDVVFAQLYFDAVSGSIQGASAVPKAWQDLFQARGNPNIDRIQFALAGMNAHINHDLALALLRADSDLGLRPLKGGPEHTDYQTVNAILEGLMPTALAFLGTGIFGTLAQDSGKIGQQLALCGITEARDMAWDFADILRPLAGPARELALVAQSETSALIGCELLA